jgi:hypothetical protein
VPKQRRSDRLKSKRDLDGQFQLAGMAIGEGSRQVGRPVDTLSVVRPKVVVLDQARGVLRYRTDSPTVLDVQRPEALDLFKTLCDAPDAEIEAFAQRFGVLRVRPFREPGIYEEDLSWWRSWASRTRAALSVAAALHQDEPGRPEDWALLGASWTIEAWTAMYRDSDLTAKEKRLRIHRNALADVVNDGLESTDVRPCFVWFRTTGGFAFANAGRATLTLSGALAVQTTLACARAGSVATCTGCGTPYMRRWHSPTGRGNYCDRCGVRAAWRDSKRRSRRQAEGGGGK